MRKLILTLATGFLSVSLFAQAAFQVTPHNRAEMLAKFKNAKAVPFHPNFTDESGVPVDNATFQAKAGSRTGEMIGSTGYDLQSNAATMYRVVGYPDGSVSALWTGSTVADGAWSDRGMFYNHSDGATWGAAPTSRVEGVRSGFGGIMSVMDHEVEYSHDGTNIRLYANSAPGATDWTELPVSGMHVGLWPRAYCPAGTDDIYMISANASSPTAITFSRSDDGGATYTVSNYVLPYLDVDNCFGALSADAYQIAVDGSTVYVLYGTSWTNLVLLTSTSNGDEGTWTSQTLIETGLCNYQGDGGQISDVDGDGIGDTVETTDGFHDMVLGPDGVLHVWSGYYWLLDDDPDVAAEGWNYFPSIYGQWYWNSTMTDPVWLDLLVDWDDSGDPFDGIGADLGMYDGVTFTSMPAASIDEATGRIYLMYTHPIEYTDYFDDPTNEFAQSFRDIFGTYSDDGGLTWSAPVNMTYTAHDQLESVYAYAYDRTIGGCVATIWMQDAEPGTSLDTNNPDAYAISDIQYRCFDEARFNPYPPVADFVATPDGITGQVSFTNLSVDADTYSWNFGDGGISSSKNPVHIYATSGTYNVCLTATNKYDDDNTCQTLDITVAINDVALNQALTVFPSPATNFINVEVAGNFGSLNTEVYNTLGERVINTVNFTGNTQLDITNLSAGTYLVKVYDEAGNYTSRQINVVK